MGLIIIVVFIVGLTSIMSALNRADKEKKEADRKQQQQERKRRQIERRKAQQIIYNKKEIARKQKPNPSLQISTKEPEHYTLEVADSKEAVNYYLFETRVRGIGTKNQIENLHKNLENILGEKPNKIKQINKRPPKRDSQTASKVSSETQSMCRKDIIRRLNY